MSVDFSSDIANHTLEQVPNALYQGGKRKTRRKQAPRLHQTGGGGGDSTDSEELDHSDSGYSSPMHRKNQTSSGTDAWAGRITDTSTYSTDVKVAALECTTNQSASYSTAQMSSAGLYHAATVHLDPSKLPHMPTPALSYSAVVSASAQHNNTTSSPSLTNTRVPTTNGGPAQQAQQDNGAKTEEGNDENPLTDKKRRRRKRGRRRRKKGTLIAF